MGHFADLAFAVLSTVFVLLVTAWMLHLILARVFAFRTEYWRVFLALFLANLAARFLAPLLFLSGLITPPPIGVQIALNYGLFYLLQAGAVLLVLSDSEGRRIPTGAGLIIAAIPVVVSAAITAFYLLLAI